MQTITKPEAKSNLVHTKEIVNWIAYRHFCEHLKEFFTNAEKNNRVLICEIWEFPDTRPPEARQLKKAQERD